MDAGCSNGRVRVKLPFGGNAAATTNPASRSTAFAPIPEESPPDSDDPDLRHDVYPDSSHGYCPRDEFLARYSPTDGAAQWGRAEDP